MIEDVVCAALKVSTALSSLARYENAPAIFYGSAANDQEAKWGSSQYPHCIYGIQWSSSTDRMKAGQLLVDIVSNNMSAAPEDIAEALAGEFSELFVTEGNDTYCIVWKQSDQFEVRSGEEPRVCGVTITFQMMAFPKNEAPVPDVVKGIAAWMKAKFAQVKVIGVDTLSSAWRATDNTPACYVRTEGITSQARSTYAVAWMVGSYVIHIICPSQKERVKLLTQIANLMALETSVILEDRSPFLLQRIAMRANADPLADGQLTIAGEYGVLRVEPTQPKLQHAYFGKE